MNCKLAVAPKFTKWEPSTIFSDTPRDKFALVILNRELQLPISVYSRLWANAVYKVAADGGANRLYDLNKNTCNNISENASPPFLHLNCIVGDLDSLRPDSRAYWVQQKVPIIHYPEQDSTDFAKAVYHIRNHFVDQHENKEEENQKSIDIVVLGDLSGRIDHAMSILHNLYTLQEKVDEENEYLAGRLYLWDVANWETQFGGQISTSNYIINNVVSIQTSKDILITLELDILSHQDETQHIIH
ncbi:thiamine pyrophosphokinase [Erysiphe necator]|nr:thiamine pyrophosphokinase [Erysiphe necator]